MEVTVTTIAKLPDIDLKPYKLNVWFYHFVAHLHIINGSGFSMAIYHLHIKNLTKKGGHIMRAAAYFCGKVLCDKQGIVYDYTHKDEVVHSEILLPVTAPSEYYDRETLWNAVDEAEIRKDARTGRAIDIALPVELSYTQQIGLVREYVHENFVKHGMCADFSLHDKGSGNPHVHILLTTRSITPEGFGLKNRSWNDRQNVNIWRKQWADMCNCKFIHLGLNQRIDHRTLALQGIDREPTIHLGQKVIAMERRGKKMERGEKYRKIIARNMELEKHKEQQREKKKRHIYSRSR